MKNIRAVQENFWRMVGNILGIIAIVCTVVMLYKGLTAPYK